jgi:hypothetical protein
MFPLKRSRRQILSQPLLSKKTAMNIFGMLKNLSGNAGVLAAVPYLENDSLTVKFVDGTSAIVKLNIGTLDIYDEEGCFARSEVLEKSDEANLSKLLGMGSRAVLAPRKF